MKPVCDTCNLQCKNITHYVNHCRTHRHIRNARFTCCITGCIRTFYTYKALVSHIARNHTAASYDQGDGHDEGLGSYRNVGVGVKCMLEFCQHQSSDIKELISHLRGHIESGLKVDCPFENCKIQFGNKKSFSSHLSRHHRNYKVGDVASRYVVTVSQGPTDVVGEAIFPIGLHNEDNSDRNELDEQDSVETEQEQDLKSRTSTSSSHEGDTVVCGENPSENVKEFTQSVALFLLKLQSKYLIPNSTIQVIVEQMCFLNQLGNENTKKCIVTQLQTAGIGLGLADERCNELAQDIMTDVSELGCSLAPASDSQHFQSPECGKLRSGYMRKKYWKENFKYVSPESIYLGEPNGGKKEYCHYVPILETLKLMYEDKSVQNHIIPVDKERSGYSDIQDGKVFRQNTFYQRNPDALQVMLFQDGFEVVNPLGSSRNKHKMLGVYCTLGNIDARCRSQIDPIQLVLLCKEKTLKKIDSQRVFSRLITDLKHLEENGIVLKNGYVVKGTVVAIIGDNLGSHYIGGFCESFSSHYYCRYCLLSKIEIAQGLPYVEGVYRTRESYRRALQSLDDDGESVHHEGIKFDSLFNSLTYFHVASPGLPPCLGHDLFEGVVDYDMALFIQYFVAKKWFSYEELNRRLQLFPFKGRDSADMLTSAVKPQGERIGGQAVQNWYFLRFFPLVVYGLVRNIKDPVWQLLLQLKEIVEIIVSPTLQSSQVAFLKVLVEEYLEGRADLFPERKLRPKHHFLLHYYYLIFMFGPLIKVWTLRFESKHSFFKRCARYCQNFVNITSTLAERHQLLQAYSFHGRLFADDVKVAKGIPFHPELYAENIQKAVLDFELPTQQRLVSDEVSVFCTIYKKDLFVIIKEDEDWTFACIMLILVVREKVVFIVQKYQTTHVHEYGLYQVKNRAADSNPVSCVAYSDLLDYCPLSAYKVDGQYMLSLKNKPTNM